MSSVPRPERILLAGDLEIPRMLNGLWQLAGGHDECVEIEAAAGAIGPLCDTGLDGFDMADHYGPAELVIGQHVRNSSGKREITAFTKWCPDEGDANKSSENAEAAVDRALDRMSLDCLPLLQYHVWDYTDDTYLHNMCHLRELQRRGKIRHLGLTNVDSEHLELLMNSGFRIASNQVSCSVIDRRLTRGRMTEVCERHQIAVLAYGTLLGGFLSEKWVGVVEPQTLEHLNWSLRKYLRFIRAAGGWEAFQVVLECLATIAAKHGVSLPAVATRYVLDIPGVKAVIIGCRLTANSKKYAERNLEAFAFSLDEGDREAIAAAQEGLCDIPGDCGDEYRRPPYLTAAGDLSHHLKASSPSGDLKMRIASGERIEYRSESAWEDIAGYCRALRNKDTVYVSGTTANPPSGLEFGCAAVGGSSARNQTVAILDNIGKALKALESSIKDVVRTRVLVRNQGDVQQVSAAHGWAFQREGIRPANTLTVSGLVGDEFLVEIEAEAVVGSGTSIGTL